MEEARRMCVWGGHVILKGKKKIRGADLWRNTSEKSELLIYFFFSLGTKTAAIVGLHIILHFFPHINES